MAPAAKDRARSGSGSVQSRPDGSFRVEASVGPRGNRRRKSAVVHGSRHDAERKLRELFAALDSVTVAPGSVAALLARYCENRERTLSPVTVAEYRRKATKIINPDIGHLAADEVTPGTLAAFYDRLAANGMGPTSIMRVHALLSAAFNQGDEWGLIKSSPARKARPRKTRAERAADPRPKVPDDVVASLEAVTRHSPMLGALLTLCAYTGMRRGEACGLKWSDVELVRGTLTVARSLHSPRGERWREGPPKGGRPRTITLGPSVVGHLLSHRLACEGTCAAVGVDLLLDGFVFTPATHPSGVVPLRPDYVTNRTRILTARRLNPHALRHFAGSKLVAGGVDVRTAAARLGHADNGQLLLSTYAHPERSAEEGAAMVADAALDELPQP